MRTTPGIDDPMLRDLKRLQQRAGKSLVRLVSDLLAQSLAARRGRPAARSFHWVGQSMGPRIDLRDKDALRDALDDPMRCASASTSASCSTRPIEAVRSTRAQPASCNPVRPTGRCSAWHG